jgi:hypothetical protein
MNSFAQYFLGAFFFTKLFELGLSLIKGAICIIEKNCTVNSALGYTKLSKSTLFLQHK